MTKEPPPDGDRPAPPRPETGVRPGVPRWVKTLGIVVAALLLLVLIVMLASGGQHGPGRHRGVSHAAAGAAVGLTLLMGTP